MIYFLLIPENGNTISYSRRYLTVVYVLQERRDKRFPGVYLNFQIRLKRNSRWKLLTCATANASSVARKSTIVILYYCTIKLLGRFSRFALIKRVRK